MKKLLAVTLLTAALTAGSAMAQSSFTTRLVRQRTNAPVGRYEQNEGSIQRGFRMGGPLNMVNPAASAEYGTGEEFVVNRPEHEQEPQQGLRTRGAARPQPVALRLFSIPF